MPEPLAVEGKNHISVITVDDTELSSHNAALTDYYKNILGVQDQPSWNFDLAALYPSTNYDLSGLVDAFTEEEAMQAVRCMNINGVHGPDGFVEL